MTLRPDRPVRPSRTRSDNPQHDLVLSAMPLVNAIVVNICGRYDADLAQEGCLALLAAAERFDPSLGVKFNTFAAIRVRGRILDALAVTGKRRAREDSLDNNEDSRFERFLAVHDNAFDLAEWAIDGPAINAAFDALLDRVPSDRDREILRRSMAGESCADLAVVYGVTDSRVSQIRARFFRLVDQHLNPVITRDYLQVA